MTTTTLNEAAERLRAELAQSGNTLDELGMWLDDALAAAKAEGAREAVERIWNRLIALPDGVAEGQLNERHVFAILDEEIGDERESSLRRDAEGHLVLTLGPGAESPSRKQTCRCGGYRPDCGHGPVERGWDELDGLSPLEQWNREANR